MTSNALFRLTSLTWMACFRFSYFLKHLISFSDESLCLQTFESYARRCARIEPPIWASPYDRPNDFVHWRTWCSGYAEGWVIGIHCSLCWKWRSSAPFGQCYTTIWNTCRSAASSIIVSRLLFLGGIPAVPNTITSWCKWEGSSNTSPSACGNTCSRSQNHSVFQKVTSWISVLNILPTNCWIISWPSH